MAISHCYWHLVVKNGNFTLLLTSSGQEWQFHIITNFWCSRMAISHCYWHLVNKNGYLTLLLTSSQQEWQFHIATDIYWSEWQFHIATDIKWSRMAISRSTPRSAGRSTLQMHHGIYIMGCIWQSFWILQEKLGIYFFFWIIRFVNSQLALYSHVRCNPPQHPPGTCQM